MAWTRETRGSGYVVAPAFVFISSFSEMCVKKIQMLNKIWKMVDEFIVRHSNTL